MNLTIDHISQTTSEHSERITRSKETHMVLQAAATSLSCFSAAIAYCIVGMLNSAPSFTPLGQREVTVLVLV